MNDERPRWKKQVPIREIILFPFVEKGERERNHCDDVTREENIGGADF